jgi:hypothetical protein
MRCRVAVDMSGSHTMRSLLLGGNSSAVPYKRVV